MNCRFSAVKTFFHPPNPVADLRREELPLKLPNFM
jgi:hypothetical protein